MGSGWRIVGGAGRIYGGGAVSSHARTPQRRVGRFAAPIVWLGRVHRAACVGRGWLAGFPTRPER